MAGEFGKHLRQRLPGILARGHGDQFRVRMVQQQLHQFFAGITGRADNGDFLRFHFSKSYWESHRVGDPNFTYRDSDTLSLSKQKTPPD